MAIPIEQLDAKVFPLPQYALSRARLHLAGKLMPLLATPPAEAESLFGLFEQPKREGQGHLSLAVTKLKQTGVNPRELAGKLAQSYVVEGDEWVRRVEPADIFLNFWLDPQKLIRSVCEEALSLRADYGRNELGGGRRIAIDFSSPNIAKPFHAGHLRSTIIGNFTKLVHRACGFDAYGINYLGDWGKQYGLLAIAFERYGKEEELAKDPIKHLYDLYVRINQEKEGDEALEEAARQVFVRMERGDEEVLAIWRRFRELSIERLKQVYARLNVEFEEYSGESLFGELMEERLAELRAKGLLVESNGAQVVDLGGKLGKALLVKQDGATLYLTRDLASCQDRFDRLGPLERSIYVVACQQDHHFQQLIAIMEKLGKPWAHRILHVSYGLVNGMSTRKGQVVFLEEILNEAQEVMHGVMQQHPDRYAQIEDPLGVSDLLALSAVVIQDMASRRIRGYDFNWERMTQFEGDTGPYLQYAHARLSSIERKSGWDLSQLTLDYELLSEPEAMDLCLLLARLPDVIQEARASLEPCNLVNYLLAVARQVSGLLDRLWVMGQPAGLGEARLALYVAARLVLGNGLRILGLKPLERM